MNQNQTQTKPLTIGRVAKLSGVGIDTIRFYERRGLLHEPARTPSGYRQYAPDIVERLHFILRAKDLGFSLEEVSLLLKLQDEGGSKAEVKKLTSQKLEQIETKIGDLERMRDVLRKLNKDCSGTGDIDSCPIIDALSDGDTCSADKNLKTGS